ncbi:protein CELLULOSE SYNTHASE INTERACTIVE 1 [Canna indica]|uniref:Protein CELLULOSE SYNTHASE INTERACTIVE 1 n=1 Tax=Canna indica TaxID=4628 RepID=A0AAQ3KJ65_9LILI|nr:protein CELLULOSE SYNTHASE INTERACTIVE 1 [Canna indica]
MTTVSLHHHDASPSNSAFDAAIVLPLPDPSASRAELAFFVRNLFARLQIGALDLKQKTLDSLLELLASDLAKLSRVVAEEGDLPYLLRLLDSPTHFVLRDCAAAAVSLLAAASDASRRAIFDEGALGSLLRLPELELRHADPGPEHSPSALPSTLALLQPSRDVCSSPSILDSPKTSEHPRLPGNQLFLLPRSPTPAPEAPD